MSKKLTLPSGVYRDMTTKSNVTVLCEWDSGT